MKQTEALRLALEALEVNDLPLDEKTVSEWELKTDAAITAIKAALEAKDEPVALETVYETIIHWDEDGGKRSRRELARRIVDLYITPPQRNPLTDEEIAAIVREASRGSAIRRDGSTSLRIARAIEAAHGIKGEA